MRTSLNAVATFLREHKQIIPDEMITHIYVEPAITIGLKFPTEHDMARFGSTNFQQAQAVRIDNDSCLLYRATFTWRRRTIVLLMSIDPTHARRVDELFSGKIAAR